MMLNLSSTLFLTSLVMGTLITISSKSWIMMWVGLEMNLLAFIPLMNKTKSPYESEASMKYFMVQAMASMMLLMSILMESMMMQHFMSTTIVLTSALLIKMGAAPFHLWFPSVMQGLSWMNCMTLMTWQKIAPMIMLSYKISNNLMMNMIILTSVIVGALGGMNQTSIRKIMAYSSISHLGWMLMAMIISNWYWSLYFLTYTVLNMAVVMLLSNSSTFYLAQVFSLKMENSTKFTLFMSMLSLGGLPPFLGFLPKWMIIQNSMMFNNKLVILVMIMTTMITLYFYLRMTYSSFSLNNQSAYWPNENPYKSAVFMSTAISLMSIPTIVIINLY